MIQYSFDNIRKWSEIGPRNIVGEASKMLAEQDKKFTLIFADCANRVGIQQLLDEHPEKCIEAGIAEQNQIGIASAMANEGFHVFAVAYAPFITARVMDHIRVNMGYMQAPLKIIGLSAGFAAGDLGATHTALEDIADLRTIPNIVVICPADCTEIVKTMEAVADFNRPVYIRLTAGVSTQQIFTDNYDFEIGRAITLVEGTDVAIFSTGAITYQALEAAKLLKAKGISCKVVNMHTIKPLDEEALRSAIHYKIIVTIEEHSIIGGLGGAVAEYLSIFKTHSPLLRIGVDDEFFCADLPEKLMERSGLMPENIARRILGNL